MFRKIFKSVKSLTIDLKFVRIYLILIKIKINIFLILGVGLADFPSCCSGCLAGHLTGIPTKETY